MSLEHWRGKHCYASTRLLIITRTQAGGKGRLRGMLTALWQLASVQHRVDVLLFCVYRGLASAENGS
jgi:hypothetical protein